MRSIPQSSGCIGVDASVQKGPKKPVVIAAPAKQGRKAAKQGRSPEPKSVAEKGAGGSQHAAPWAFGGGRSAEAASRGIRGDSLMQHAHSGPAEQKTAETEDRPATGYGSGTKNAFDLRVSREAENWRGGTRDNDMGEDVALDSSHRVSAFAGVKDKDMSFGMGPEVVVRSRENVQQNMGKSDQPDVTPGVGMRFKMEF